MRRLLLVLLVLAAGICEARAWGAAGHAIVAELAQRQVRPETLSAIRQILGQAVSMASVSSWADTMALLRPETRPWHFVNIRVGSDRYDPPRDCPQDQCIVAVISRERAILADRAAPAPQRAEALRYLIHLVADIHQPLHCATRGPDLGASLLPVTWLDRPTNLHAFWDVTLVESMSYDWGFTVDRLAALPSDPAGREGEPADWAWQSYRVAVETAYGIPPDGVLTEDYRLRAAAAADRQLIRAAARLAAMLDAVLGD